MCDVLTSAMAPGRFSRPVHHGDEGDVRPLQQAPHYYGGQAVIEGVMMRGATTWAVAVRRPDEDIWLEQHPVGDVAHRHPVVKKPLLRGVYALVDSIGIGVKALGIAAEQASVEEEQDEPRPVAIGASMVLALVIFVGLFIILPSTAISALDRFVLGGAMGDGALFHVIESFARIAVFLTYIGLISRIKEIHRVFEYHGAEHKTINAWEHGDQLSPADVDTHDKAHVRCGTNFLILVMLLAMLVYTLAGTVIPAPDGGIVAAVSYHVLLRVLLLPLVAGLAYEALRIGAEKNDWAWVRMLMAPGLWLQKITTQAPDHGQLEVAIRAFEAVVPDDALGDRVVQDTLPSTIVRPAVPDPALDDLEDPGDEPVPGELIA